MSIPTIVIENSDSKIWHLEKFLLELTLAFKTRKSIVIGLNNEGPCADSLGLYNLLDSYCQAHDYDRHAITIATCNLVEHHTVYNLRIDEPLKGVAEWQNKLKQTPYFVKKIHSKTRHFGSFVGRGNRLRLSISSYLYKHYRELTLQSYHTDINNDYFREHLALEEMLNNGYSWDEVLTAVEFLKQCPMKLDAIEQYPILHETKVYDLLDYYPDIFVDIVNQTYFSGNTFYLDDHLWRSIITKTPFIVQGPANFLTNLKKLGFKTFDRWWDEGYAEDPPDYQCRLIKQNIDQLAKCTLDQLSAMYQDMTPVLDHNLDVFLSLDKRTFQDFIRNRQ